MTNSYKSVMDQVCKNAVEQVDRDIKNQIEWGVRSTQGMWIWQKCCDVCFQVDWKVSKPIGRSVVVDLISK
jgi:hypothetical protein